MRCMLLSISLTLATTLAAQWTTPDLNTAVSATSGAGASTPLSAPGPDGSSYVTWFENATGAYVLKMQRLDVDGQALWAPGGIVVSDEPQNSALFRFDFKSDHAGNAIVVFQDERSGALDVVAYKISPAGDALWAGGLPLLTPGATGIGPVIGVLADDRIVFAWNTDRTPQTVAYRVVEPDGSLSGDPLEIGASGITGRPKVVPTSDGGFWLQYVHQPGNFLSPGTMYAVRCDGDGVAGPTIAIAANTINGFYFPEPISDGHDGLYVAFNTGNVANGSITDVCVQRLRANGVTWANTGRPVEDGVLTQRYTGTATPALVNDDAGLMIAYIVTNLNQSEGGIAVQRFDTAGAALLGATGPILVASSTALPQLFGNAAVADGVVAVYTTGGFGAETAHAVRTDLNGTVVGTPAIIDVSTASSSKDDATLIPFRDGQAVAVWQDERNGSTIYAQPIEVDNSTSVTESNENGIVLLAGEAAEILFLQAAPASQLCITDAQGRLVHQQFLPAQGQGSRVPLPLHDAPAGMYLVTLEGPDVRMVQRLVR
jgi:hypothetical protein